jgi:hypothetical protein
LFVVVTYSRKRFASPFLSPKGILRDPIKAAHVATSAGSALRD